MKQTILYIDISLYQNNKYLKDNSFLESSHYVKSENKTRKIMLFSQLREFGTIALPSLNKSFVKTMVVDSKLNFLKIFCL